MDVGRTLGVLSTALSPFSIVGAKSFNAYRTNRRARKTQTFCYSHMGSRDRVANATFSRMDGSYMLVAPVS